jgi:hypothetical protein
VLYIILITAATSVVAGAIAGAAAILTVLDTAPTVNYVDAAAIIRIARAGCADDCGEGHTYRLGTCQAAVKPPTRIEAPDPVQPTAEPHSEANKTIIDTAVRRPYDEFVVRTDRALYDLPGRWDPAGQLHGLTGSWDPHPAPKMRDDLQLQLSVF